MTSPRGKVSESLAARGRPENWANEQEAADLSGMSLAVFQQKLPDLEKRGFPKQNHLNGVRWRESIQSFWSCLTPDMVRALRRADDPVIYFVRAKESGRIKIGFSNNLPKRLIALAIGCPEDIEVLGTTPGSQYHERELHKRFAAIRIRGEWFAPAAELLAYIAEVTK